MTLRRRGRSADCAACLEDLGRQMILESQARQDAQRWQQEARSSAQSARRWRRKALPLAVGSGVAVYGLARERPWITAGGLALGIGGSLIF